MVCRGVIIKNDHLDFSYSLWDVVLFLSEKKKKNLKMKRVGAEVTSPALCGDLVWGWK